MHAIKVINIVETDAVFYYVNMQCHFIHGVAAKLNLQILHIIGPRNRLNPVTDADEY